MRLFIAVPIADKVRAAAARIISGLKESAADVKWVEPENLHLTLRFLGDVPEEEISTLKDIVVQTAAGNSSFKISFDRLGAFGAPSRPRILWMGIGSGAKALSELAASLRGALGSSELGSAADHEFSAHLTLGRVRGTRNHSVLVNRLEAISVPAGLSCRAEKLVLFESRLDARGPTYKAVLEARLRLLID